MLILLLSLSSTPKVVSWGINTLMDLSMAGEGLAVPRIKLVNYDVTASVTPLS